MITDEQLRKIEATMLDEYMQRVCKFVSEDDEFSWMIPQRIRKDAEKIMDEKLQVLFKDEKCAAEFVKLSLSHPKILSVPYGRDIRNHY